MNIFEYAAINELRFPSSQGYLTTEQLFHLPLTSTTQRANLNEIGKSIRNLIKNYDSDEDLVNPKASIKKERTDLEVAFDIVKYVIEYKQSISNAKEQEKLQAEQRKLLNNLLQEKKFEGLKSLTEEEILKKIEELGK